MKYLKKIKSSLMLCGMFLGAMAIVPIASVSFAEQQDEIVSKLPPAISTTIEATAEFFQGAYVEVKYERAKTAASAPFAGPGHAIVSNAVMRVSSLPGETAVMTCSVQNGSAATRRDCTGSAQTVNYAVNGERRFGNDVELGNGLMGGLDGRAHNNIEIDLSYL